ncbi:MAG: DnaJ domain-containing protein [Spirochaetales bacterium]|nr:DnaJ domain-containing protein [Spirochaetales bacterium]
MYRDYYEILGVEKDSSSRDIKRSFRRKAKELHPDISVSSKRATEDAFKLLLRAYEVLSNPAKRELYDRTLSHINATWFDYREFLKKKQKDMKSQSKLIFYDLLHDNPDEAIELYCFLSSNPAYQMHKYLDYGDYLECIFLLAEEFEKRGEYIRAYEFLKKIYTFEQKIPFFKQYMVEIMMRLKTLVCVKMTRYLSPLTAVKYINELIALNYPKKETAKFYRICSELYLAAGEKESAEIVLKKGLELDRKLKGIKKLMDKINTPENIRV